MFEKLKVTPNDHVRFDETTSTTGTATQFPLKLADAVTAHKVS